MRPRFSPGEKPERPADPAVRRANLRRVFGLFKAYRWRLSVVLALIGFSALLSIVSPFLVRTGETVDILLDVTNVGRWMAHCHIAEHHESGMMFSFNVAPADDDAPST